MLFIEVCLFWALIAFSGAFLICKILGIHIE
jgi:hypothetical protein